MRMPAPAPNLFALMNEAGDRRLSVLVSDIGMLVSGKYLHWDDLSYRDPPSSFSHREWWLGIKLARMGSQEHMPFVRKSGPPFILVHAKPVLKGLHEIDRKLGVSGYQDGVADLLGNGAKQLLVNSVLEEAIRSSQLEGASTTRRRAKEMIRNQATPENRSERMILNNYRAMLRVDDLAGAGLTKEGVFELHKILVEDTLDDPTKAGRFREDKDNIVVGLNSYSDETAHVPPPAAELPERLDRLVAFANGKSPDDWMHPVLRALIIHFMIGYDHPFIDGNGRVARALFYWSMLREGYGLAKYLAVSKILREAPSQYGKSFLHTETDSGDLTYFVVHQIHVILRSIEALTGYVERQQNRIHEVRRQLHGAPGFNDRQLRLLEHAMRNPGFRYSVQSHARSHRVAPSTARADLMELVQNGFLIRAGHGRQHGFIALRDMQSAIRRFVRS